MLIVFYIVGGPGRNRKTERKFLAKNLRESGSRLFLSDGEEKSCDRFLPGIYVLEFWLGSQIIKCRDSCRKFIDFKNNRAIFD